LADKDEYIYFARTCFADDSQGQLLADALDDVGLVPFIAVISSSDSYAQSLSFSIIENYQAKGHIVLLNYQFTPVDNETAVYTQILDEIAASGAPVTVLVMYADEVEHLLAAVAEHPVYKYDTMVWVGIEMWVNVKGPWNKKGMVGLKPYVPSTNITASYMDLWANLNPAEFIDSDGDRSSLGSNTLYVADAVFALAQAFQKVTGSETGSSGDALKREVFTHITNDVEFKGKLTLI
jgi:ABC-type branched-subunit amino acid transport system substrate-binding protein